MNTVQHNKKSEIWKSLKLKAPQIESLEPVHLIQMNLFYASKNIQTILTGLKMLFRAATLLLLQAIEYTLKVLQ